MFDRRLIQNFDWFVLLLLLLICGLSLLNLYSATYAIRAEGGGEIFTKQIYWYVLGFIIMILMTTFNYQRLEQVALIIYIISIALLVLVLFVGKVISGSQRWLVIGGISFQPSELTKIALVLVLSRFFLENREARGYGLKELWQPFLYIALPFFLVVKQPDLGTALLLVAIGLSVIFVARIKTETLLILSASTLIIAPLLWFNLKGYQQKRILAFLRPDLDPLGAGYHINQSKIAIGSGLFWGKGYLEGTQTRLHFLPEQHTDFAFSVWAEEWGLVGSIVLLALYLLLILWGIFIAKNSKERFGAFLAVGLTSIIFWHVIINIGMVTGLLPVVGIPLLLFSYGGSSLVITMAALGLLMNIRMRRFMFQ